MRFQRLKRFVRSWLLNRRFKTVAGISQRLARWLSPHFTANQVTLIGLIACIPMTFFYLLDLYLPAGILLIFSFLTDWADGALAHYQQGLKRPMTLDEERQLGIMARISYRGVTHLGKSLDPIVDKARFFCVLYSLGIGVVSLWLVIALSSVALALTLVRPVKRWLNMGDGRSNRLGKYKIWAELIAIALLVLSPTNRDLLNLTFVVALLFGMLSFVGHLIAGYVELRTRRIHKKAVRMRQRRSPDALPDGFRAEDF